MRLRIGVSRATKELDLEVDDAQQVVDDYAAALDGGERLLWATETDGRRFAIVADDILYFELEADGHKAVGFGA